VDCYRNRKFDMACLGKKLRLQLLVYIIDNRFIKFSFDLQDRYRLEIQTEELVIQTASLLICLNPWLISRRLFC
jgi:hypothetical protein